MGMQYDSDQIAEILPHRYPFALVDRIVDGEEGKWAKGIKCVTVNEPFFQGHFPQKHVMPGVLIVEAMAQVGGVAVLALPSNRGKLAFLPLPPSGGPRRCAGDHLHADEAARPGRDWRGGSAGRRRAGRVGGADVRHRRMSAGPPPRAAAR